MIVLLFVLLSSVALAEKPWDNGRLTVRGQYLVHENGHPFFWLGNTAWLMPERLNRDEVKYYLSCESAEGYNVEQIQVLDASYPTFNVYGRQAFDDSFNMEKYAGGASANGQSSNVSYTYWDHLNYIVSTAERMGIYIAMDCIWGGQVSRLTPEKASRYGRFLGERYKSFPNIIWMIGGDIMGDKGMESWDALARAIKSVDDVHLMTFHPRGRTTSAWWFNDREWLDFNMFQSGHRRYGQRNGDGDYTIRDNTEEDNWRYVAMSFGDAHEQIDGRVVRGVRKPVLDGEPSYEDIPQGLHDLSAPRWQDYDVRRYAYWSVFAGSCGHTYGHNSIMQFMRPGYPASFGADKAWWDALQAPGYRQMKYLKRLMVSVPFTDGRNDQSVIVGQNGSRYDRVIATCGRDYMLVYNYSGRPVALNLTKISGAKKHVWLMNPADGMLTFLGEYEDASSVGFTFDVACQRPSDRVLIVTDSRKSYFSVSQQML